MRECLGERVREWNRLGRGSLVGVIWLLPGHPGVCVGGKGQITRTKGGGGERDREKEREKERGGKETGRERGGERRSRLGEGAGCVGLGEGGGRGEGVKAEGVGKMHRRSHLGGGSALGRGGVRGWRVGRLRE